MNLWIFGFKFINLVENHIMRYLFVFLLFINSILVQSQTEKQPNCADIDGLLITDYDELDNISASYSGIVFDCSYTGKVNALYHFKNLYPRPGSNRHSRKNRILNPARLPVPPLGPSNSERQK